MWDAVFADMPSGFWPAMRHVLWRVDYSDPLAMGYSILNLIEACFWFGIAGWVIQRHLRQSGGLWNYAYVVAFVVFGATDLVESQIVPVWLIPAKILVLVGLLVCRAVVVRRYYPQAKM
ncbi:MAG: hypothetical protein IT441_10365 [Phycisphaeraceae bacterium]|nr:hypothetical protein [Phycisphaeraceae bacterium]